MGCFAAVKRPGDDFGQRLVFGDGLNGLAEFKLFPRKSFKGHLQNFGDQQCFAFQRDLRQRVGMVSLHRQGDDRSGGGLHPAIGRVRGAPAGQILFEQGHELIFSRRVLV